MKLTQSNISNVLTRLGVGGSNISSSSSGNI